MKRLLLLLTLSLFVFSACGIPSEPTSPGSTKLGKAIVVDETFPYSIYTDCCGGEYLTFDMNFHLVTRPDGAVIYNWKANDRVVGESGHEYHVVFTDNGVRSGGDDGAGGWVGTLHARVTRDDGCTFTWTVKIRIRWNADGTVVKEVLESTVTCE